MNDNKKEKMIESQKVINKLLTNKKILKVEQFRTDEIVIFCENYKFFIDVNKNGNLEFSITEN